MDELVLLFSVIDWTRVCEALCLVEAEECEDNGEVAVHTRSGVLVGYTRTLWYNVPSVFDGQEYCMSIPKGHSLRVVNERRISRSILEQYSS